MWNVPRLRLLFSLHDRYSRPPAKLHFSAISPQEMGHRPNEKRLEGEETPEEMETMAVGSLYISYLRFNHQMVNSPKSNGGVETSANEDGLDSILLAIENPVRRKIIRRLSKQPSYQLHISKELGFSQQLVAKHLDAMEGTGLVSSLMEESPHGPKRREYLLNKSISLSIDFAPNLFRARLLSFDSPEKEIGGTPTTTLGASTT